MSMEKVNDGIYRICIPFEGVYTTAFILTNGKDALILDSGATSGDAKNYIVPAVSKTGVSVKYLLTTHDHSDHSGGMNELKKTYPKAMQVQHPKDGDIFFKRFKIISLSGHTEDSIGVLDIKTNTLLTGDCLQMYGVGSWGGNFDNYRQYLDSINRVRNMRLETIITAHDYIPYGYKANGEEEIERLLKISEKAVFELVEFVKDNDMLSDVDTALKFRKEYPELPPIGADKVTNIRKILLNGE